MELRDVLSILRRWWLIVLTGLMVAAGSSAALVRQLDDVYEAESTFVIQPSVGDRREGLRALDTLVRGSEINATYAAIARSDRVRDRAAAKVGTLGMSGIEVKSDVMTGTNILKLVVAGTDPEHVHEAAVAMSSETMSYVAELDEIFALAPLDAPTLPRRPAGPDRPLLIATGAVLGLVLGGLLAMLAEALARRTRPTRRAEAEAGSAADHGGRGRGPVTDGMLTGAVDISMTPVSPDAFSPNPTGAVADPVAPARPELLPFLAKPSETPSREQHANLILPLDLT